MKMIRRVVLSSAAGLLALHGAQAADLPVKAKAVEYLNNLARSTAPASTTFRARTAASRSAAICVPT